MDIHLAVWIAAMLISVIACAIGWDRGVFFQSLPIVWGVLAGAYEAFLRATESSVTRNIEIIASCTLVGIVLWFSVWIQVRRKRGDARE